MNAVNAEQKPAKKRGCLFYGCLSVIVLSLVVVLMGYLGFRVVIRWINDNTDTKPALIETIEVSPAELEALKGRIAAFKEALDNQKVSAELKLSAQDINALIATEPKLKELKNKVFVIIDDNRLKGNVSYPLGDFGPFRLKGRYANGTATFKTSLQNGIPVVTLEDIEVKGKRLPDQFLTELRKKNLVQDMQRDADTARALQKFDSIQVKDGFLVLKNKVNQ